MNARPVSLEQPKTLITKDGFRCLFRILSLLNEAQSSAFWILHWQCTCFRKLAVTIVEHISESPVLLCVGMAMQDLAKTRQNGIWSSVTTVPVWVLLQLNKQYTWEDDFWKLGKALQWEQKYLNGEPKKKIKFLCGFFSLLPTLSCLLGIF